MKDELFREIERMKAILLKYKQDFVVNKGASDEDIERIERIVGIGFDDDFKDFYKFSNGSGDEVWGGVFSDEPISISFLSLESALEEWTAFKPYDEKQYREWSKRFSFDLAKLDNRIRPFWRHKFWFPFADFGNGVSTVKHDPDFVDYVADCFLNFLRMSNKLLEEKPELFEEWAHSLQP
ncbi:MAG: SMI1/KNR4 family protein [archaeon]|nr:SMI1/KNR4 family protein [archaeon]MCP8313717.1 SMI1/KNR4 family protein [archaeon]